MAKKIGLALLVLVLLVGAGLFWLWHRLTALPEWYQSGELVSADGTPRVDGDWVRIPDEEAEGGEAYQLRNPHLRIETPQPTVRDAIKASRAVYREGQGEIEAGAVINLSEVDVDTLPPKDREQLHDAIEAFPALTGRDVHVGVEGRVRDAEGKLALGPDAQLRIGDTRHSLATAAERLGMSEAELRSLLDKELTRLAPELP